MKNRILFSVFALVAVTLFAQGKQKDFVLQSGQPVVIACSGSEAPVVHTSLDLLSRDLQTVLSATAHVDTNTGNIIVGTIGQSKLIEQAGIDISALKNKKQAFLLTVSEDGKLVVAGSDSHGTAYGILEISRLLGVSPWEWWADVTPEKKETFRLSGKFRELQSPSVEYRGIFINDEDWGLMPWSNKTYEPSDVKGEIGPRTNERIFELLLRLRVFDEATSYIFYVTKSSCAKFSRLLACHARVYPSFLSDEGQSGSSEKVWHLYGSFPLRTDGVQCCRRMENTWKRSIRLRE